MSRELLLTLPLPVSVNHYTAHRVCTRGKGKFVTTYKTAEAKNYEFYAKKEILKAIKEQDWIVPSDNAFVHVDVTWYIKQKNMDTNNLWKQLCDSLERNGVYKSDSRVKEKTLDFFIDTKNPRAEVKVYISEKQGVFKNKEAKNVFCKNNCYQCSRKTANCTTLRKLLENRIIEEVDLAAGVCYKKKEPKSKSKGKKKCA